MVRSAEVLALFSVLFVGVSGVAREADEGRIPSPVVQSTGAEAATPTFNDFGTSEREIARRGYYFELDSGAVENKEVGNSKDLAWNQDSQYEYSSRTTVFYSRDVKNGCTLSLLKDFPKGQEPKRMSSANMKPAKWNVLSISAKRGLRVQFSVTRDRQSVGTGFLDCDGGVKPTEVGQKMRELGLDDGDFEIPFRKIEVKPSQHEVRAKGKRGIASDAKPTQL